MSSKAATVLESTAPHFANERASQSAPQGATSDSRFGYGFYLEHESGEHLYPVRMCNRDTGQKMFRVSKAGNTKAEGREVRDEDELYRLVASGSYSVRVAALRGGGPPNLLKVGQRCVRRIVKIG